MPYSLPIEDETQDVLAKAMRGLGLNRDALATRTGIPTEKLAAVLEGQVEPAALALLAPALELGGEALLALAVKGEQAPEPTAPEGLIRVNSPYQSMTVNAYLVFDPASKHALIFDSGADATELLEAVERLGLLVDKILITHTHGDHIFDIDRLREKTGASAYAPAAEPIEGCLSIAPGDTLESGALRVEARATTGHSVGGTTYVIHGLATPLAIVGDAIFARSMGGPNISYEDCLRLGRESILSLPDETILCPGHGPFTTVGTEKRWNPFFSATSSSTGMVAESQQR